MKWNKQAYDLGDKNTENYFKNDDQSIPKGPLKNEVSLEQAIEDFLMMAKVEGRAGETLKLYNYVFDNFVKAVGKDVSVDKIEKRQIRKHLASLMDQGLKNTSVAIHHRVLNAFFRWLVEDAYLKNSPMEGIKEPKTPDKFPKSLNDEQVNKLIRAAESRKRKWSGYRNYTMIVVFLDMGLRLSEFINAELDDLDLKRRSLKVHGKGAKDRKVFFGKKTFHCLRHWLRIRDDVEQVWDDTVFISQNGDKLKKRNVQRLITRIQKKADLEEIQVSPHVLRHTAATLAVQNGLDAFSLKRQFGWEKIQTALRYVHMSGKKVQEAYLNSSPMDNLR